MMPEIFKPDSEMFLPREYCGRQRTGKSTLMNGELILRLLYPIGGYQYKPDDVILNYLCFIPGVHCLSNEEFLKVYERARDECWTHKIFGIDECSQPPMFYARNSRSELQTKLVTWVWQMPKLRNLLLFSTNLHNSADIQLRDGTGYIVLAGRYNKHPQRERETIDFMVGKTRDRGVMRVRCLIPAKIQTTFDSDRPVK